jgi:uncharacterized protein
MLLRHPEHPLPPPAVEGEPPAPAARRTTTARTAVLVTISALLVGSLLNADTLAATAQAQTPGWRRTIAVPLTDVLGDVSGALGLDRPRAWIDDARRSLAGHPSAGAAQARTVFVPSKDRPARLWVAGDSLTDTLGPALLNAVDGTGVVKVRREVQYSSCLNRPVFDWPARMDAELTAHPADIVVFMIGANDGVPIETAGDWVGTDNPAWRDAYRRRVSEAMDRLEARTASVYWVGQPITRSDTLSAKVAVMNAIYRSEAAKRPRVRYVDAWNVLADASGRYSAYLPDSSGRPELVRRADGVHLTAAGADRLATAVLDAIRQDWRLPE